MKAQLLSIFLLLIVLSCNEEKEFELDKKRIYAYLDLKYAPHEGIRYGKVEEAYNNVFFHKNTPPKLERIQVNLLEQKTNRKYYKIVLPTLYLEYPELEIIIALPIERSESIFELKSPTFSAAPRAFFDMFSGMKITKEGEKLALAKEVAYLFEAVTYKGSIQNCIEEQYNVECEVWHLDKQWRVLNFLYLQDSLITFEVLNPDEKPRTVVEFDISCLAQENFNQKSELKEKAKRLEALAYNYLPENFEKIEIEDTRIFEGLKRLKTKGSRVIRDHCIIKNLDNFPKIAFEARRILVKATKEIGGGYFARASIEEIIFKSEDCASLIFEFLDSIRIGDHTWHDIDKPPNSIFQDGNKLYYIRAAGWYMMNFYEEIGLVMKE